jgi:hypothetical protein
VRNGDVLKSSIAKQTLKPRESSNFETSRNVMAKQGEGVVVPTQTEVLNNVDDDLDRIELWTAHWAASSILLPRTKPAP